MTRKSRRSPFIRACAWVFATLLAACSTLPSLDGRTISTAFSDTATTTLGRAIAPRLAGHSGEAGIYPLSDARDAFAARMLLARAAERSLDAQYYIWRKDTTGTLLFHALRAAADRGVRVRLLLDDNNTTGLDATLAALHGHPNIEVRLFNPFRLRSLRLIGYLTEFSRLDRRMHNKSFTVDNQATIIGGRNIGDEYFGATEGVLFVDLDVLAAGPVVADVSAQFDRYWASAAAYPVDRLLPRIDAEELERLAREARALEDAPQAQTYVNAVRDSPFVRELLEHKLPLTWAPTRMVSDDPAKVLGNVLPDALVTTQLEAIIGTPANALDVVSPYFVPGVHSTAALTRFARTGVRVRVLTNALEATDVVAVHAGYAKRREALLARGVRLYELRRLSAILGGRRTTGRMGSSGSSLHAKTFSVDGSRVFVGSFNFDPRSARLNTELGFVIDSAPLAMGITATFDEVVPTNAYEVRLTPDGELYWIEHTPQGVVRHDTEPGTRWWQRAAVWLLQLLPIDSLL